MYLKLFNYFLLEKNFVKSLKIFIINRKNKFYVLFYYIILYVLCIIYLCVLYITHTSTYTYMQVDPKKINSQFGNEKTPRKGVCKSS